MEISIVFKIASIGFIISVINIILTKAGRDEYTMITTISGIIITIAMIIDDIKELFLSLQNLFNI